MIQFLSELFLYKPTKKKQQQQQLFCLFARNKSSFAKEQQITEHLMLPHCFRLVFPFRLVCETFIATFLFLFNSSTLSRSHTNTLTIRQCGIISLSYKTKHKKRNIHFCGSECFFAEYSLNMMIEQKQNKKKRI